MAVPMAFTAATTVAAVTAPTAFATTAAATVAVSFALTAAAVTLTVAFAFTTAAVALFGLVTITTTAAVVAPTSAVTRATVVAVSTTVAVGATTAAAVVADAVDEQVVEGLGLFAELGQLGLDEVRHLFERFGGHEFQRAGGGITDNDDLVARFEPQLAAGGLGERDPALFVNFGRAITPGRGKLRPGAGAVMMTVVTTARVVHGILQR
jgi:hypothetical protein